MGCDGSNGLKKTRPCRLCGKKISDSLKTVKNHALRAHIKPLRCNLCGLRFGKDFELNRHKNGAACKGKQSTQFSVPGSYTMTLAEKIKECKDKDQIDKILLNANREHLNGCDKLLLEADRYRGYLDDCKYSDQDGDYELDPEYTEHTETHISNGPPLGEKLHSKYIQTETWGSEYGDNIMDVVPPREFDRVLGPLTPSLAFEQILLLDHYMYPPTDQAGMLPFMAI
ncbi:hypothetical protein DFP73DRAFT_396490 [Morchella snyderi]|nr:hypothetical protein DFP73DRAFT_396490 [Morchella snyderi]